MVKESPIAITISRQLGAGGRAVGQCLASRLEFTYLDRDILRMAADRLGVEDAQLCQWDEHLPSSWERFLQMLSACSPEATYTPLGNLPNVSESRLYKLESLIIREAASRRNVVVIGRAGFWVLRDHPQLIRVYLHAPLSARLPVVMRGLNLPSEQEARKAIDRADAERVEFVHVMTGRVSNDAQNYDLCINTDHIGLELATEIIMRAVNRMRPGGRLPAARVHLRPPIHNAIPSLAGVFRRRTAPVITRHPVGGIAKPTGTRVARAVRIEVYDGRVPSQIPACLRADVCGR